MKKRLFCILISFISTISIIEAAASKWVDSKRHADTAYFLHNSTPRIEAYDLTNGQWLSAITLPRIPTAFHVDEKYLIIAYGQTVYRYDHDGSNETHLGNFTSNINGLFTDGDHLFVFHGNVEVLNKETALKINNDFSGYGLTYIRTGVSHSPEANRFFGRSTGISPSDIGYLSYNDSGELLAAGDSPHHGAYSSATMTWPWPDGSRVADSAGNVYSSLTLNYLNSFATQIDDLDFHGGDIPIVLSGSRISAFSKSVLETGYKDLHVTPQHIYVRSHDVAAFYSDDASVNGMNVTFVNLDELSTATPGQPVNPTELAFTPDDSFIGNDGNLYLLSKAHTSLFRWDINNHEWLSAIPLLGSPEHAKYSSETNTVYTDYSDGRVYSINLNDSDPAEVAFFNLSGEARGFATAGEFLIVLDSSRNTISIDSSGSIVQTAYSSWNYDFSDATWSPDNRTLYHFRDRVSPNDLIKGVVNSDGTFGEHKDSPYHSSTGIQYPIRLNDNGTVLLLGSGRFYNPLTLEQVNTLPEPLVDATWIDGELFTIHDNATIKTWSNPTYAEGAVHHFQGSAHRIFAISTTRFLLLYIDPDGVPRMSIYDTSYDLIPPAVLAAPSLTLVRNSASAATLDWSNIAGEEAFILERKVGSDGNWIELTTTGMDLTGYVDTSVATGNTYYYRVKADNDGLESAYSNEVEVDLVYDPIDATPIPAPGVAFTADDYFIGNGNILYMLSKANESLFRWNIDTQSWLSTISLKGAPEYITYSDINHSIYLAYDNGNIFQINLHGSPLVEVAFANLATKPRGLIAAGEFIVGADESGAWESHTSFAQDGSTLDYDDWNRPFTQAAWNEVTRRIYHFRDDTSPNDLHYEEITTEGKFGAQGESPYHSSTGIKYPIRVKPDGSIVVLGSGRIYNATSLELLNTLPNDIDDVTWLNGEIYALEGSMVKQYLRPTYALGPSITLQGSGKRILTTIDQRLLTISTGPDGRPRINVYNADFSLSPPSNLSQPVAFLNGISSSSATFDWTDVGGESGYRIERRDSPTGPWMQVGSTGADITSYTDSNLAVGNYYSFRVQAINGPLESAYSNNLDASLLLPSEVTNLSAVLLNGNQTSLNWDDTDNGNGFQILRSTDSNNFSELGTVSADTLNFLDTDLVEGVTYFYKVVAFNAIGDGPASAVKSITIPITPPLPPSSVTVTPVGAKRMDVDWSNVSREDQYIIERATAPVSDNWQLVHISGANITNFSDTSVMPDTEYIYRVTARNAGGDSAATMTLPARTGVLTIPSQPASVSVVRTDGNAVTISWTPVLDVETYTIFRRISGTTTWNEIASVSGDQGYFLDESISSGVTYEYTTTAGNASGTSAYGDPRHIEIRVEYFLLSDDFDSGNYSDAWQNITGGALLSDDQEASTFILYFSQAGTRSATTRALNVSQGGRIEFTIRAGNQSVDGWNNSELGENLFFEYSTDGVAWTLLRDLNGVFPSLSKWETYTLDIPEGAQSENTYFRWRQNRHNGTDFDVWALDDVWVSSYTRPTEIPAPAAPSYLVTDSNSATSIVLLWQAVSNASSYTIERQVSGQRWTVIDTVSGLDNFYVDTQLSPKSLYSYRVFASNSGGDSPYSISSIESTWSRIAEWRFKNYGTTEATEKAAPEAVSSGNISNLLKYAFNMDVSESHTWTQGLTEGLPQTVLDEDGCLVVRYLRMRAASKSGINYEVQYSNDLGEWLPLAGTETSTPVDDIWELVSVKDSVPAITGGSRFLRVSVSEDVSAP